MPEYATPWPPTAARAPSPAVWYVAIALLAAMVAGGVVMSLWVQTLFALVGASFLLAVVIHPLVGLLAWLVTAPVLNYYVQVSLGPGVPDITFQRMIVGLLLAVLFTPVLLGRKPFPALGRTEQAMLLFTVVGLGACFIARPPLHTNLELFFRAYAMPFLLFFIAKHVVQSDRDIRTVLWLVVPQAVYLSTIGIYQRFTGTVLLVPATATVQPIYLLQVGRATGPFANAVEFGMVLAIGLMVMVVLIAHRRHDAHAVVLWPAVPVAALGLFYCYTRAVWLGLAFGLLALYTSAPRVRRLLRRAAMLATVAAVLAAPLFLRDSLFRERLSATLPITGRLLMYPTALRMAAHRPFFGYGVGPTSFADARGGFFESFAGIGISTAQTVNPPHNELLHVLVLTGLVGMIPYVAIYYHIWRQGRRLAAVTPANDAFGRTFLGLYRGVFAVLIVNMLFVDLMFLTYITGFVFFFFGLMQARLRWLETPSFASASAGGVHT